MPPRSFYLGPEFRDYRAYLIAYAPEAVDAFDEFVERTNLPYIGSALHLATYLGISDSLVRQILHKPEYHYRSFQLLKRNGGKRTIRSPKTYLKVIHWWILDNILSRVSLSDFAHGFVRGRDYVSNATCHVGKKHVLNVDIREFFPSISRKRVDYMYRTLGYSHEASKLLSGLCTLHGCAPMGAPTSPAIGNIILRELDEKLHDLAREQGMVFSRYADDLTFSSQEWIEGSLVDVIAKMVADEGFVLNPEKTRFCGPGDRMEVTGVTINNGLNAPRNWRNSIRGFLNRVEKNPRQFVDQFNYVAGVFGTLKSIDPNMEKKITRQASRTLDALRGEFS